MTQYTEQLNAAKGRLKTVLHRELYNPIDGLLKHPDCEDAPHVLYGYEQSLSNTGAWPLETNFMRTSVWDILRELERFQILPAVRATSCGRGQCDFDMYVRAVATAVRKTKDYFDGLCLGKSAFPPLPILRPVMLKWLDCMNKSNPKLGDHHEDYWSHSKLTVPWDYGCRVSHTQPSWYFSFMGRRQKMTEYTKSRGRGRFHDRE